MKPFSAIYAYNNCDLDKVYHTQQNIISHTGQCCVISTQDKPPVSKMHWYYIGKNASYLEFWNKLLRLFNSDRSFDSIVQTQGGLEFNNWQSFCNELNESYEKFRWGIYSPFINDSILYPPTQFREHPGGYRSIDKSDNLLWVLSRDLISNCVEQFNENQDVHNYFNNTCNRNGHKILLDYNVRISEKIDKINYDTNITELYFDENTLYLIYQEYYINNKPIGTILNEHPEASKLIGNHETFDDFQDELFLNYNLLFNHNKLYNEEIKEKYRPICHQNHIHSKSDLIIVTSLSPKAHHFESQKRALNTWTRTGLEIFTVNSEDEQEKLIPDYKEVKTWVQSYNNGSPIIQSFVDLCIDLDQPILIINSDIEMYLYEDFQLIPSIGLRHNYDTYYNKASLEPHGIDVFLLMPWLAKKLNNQFIKIGEPGWDYFMLYSMRELSDVKQLSDPIFFHKRHKINWSKATYERNLQAIHDLDPKYAFDWNEYRIQCNYQKWLPKH